MDPDEEWISKSQHKRDSEALKQLGKKLCALNSEQLAKVPLDDKLQDAITLAHKISNKRGALKRHYQYIGKLLRSIDSDPIQKAVAEFDAEHTHSIQAFKKLEQWRDRILIEGGSAIQEYCELHTNADRQKLRQISRNHQHTTDDSKKLRFARMLFKELRETQNVTTP